MNVPSNNSPFRKAPSSFPAEHAPTPMTSHAHKKEHRGPDIPRRYGSARSEICSCGAWRMVTHYNKSLPEWDWRTDPIEDHTTRDSEL